MPNVAPRGLYGWPREGSGQSASAASAVWVAKPDGSWCAATRVYEWCVTDAHPDGAWTGVWANADGATPPPGVSISKRGGNFVNGNPLPITVIVNWSLPPVVFATEWRVVRPDGTIVGTVPVGQQTLTDSDPRPMVNGRYTVYGVVGGTQGTTGTASVNTLTLGSAPLVSTAVMNIAANYVTLNMAGQSPDDSTSVQLWRVGEAAPWWTGNPWRIGVIWSDPNYPPGASVVYRAVAMVNGRAGQSADWPVVTTKPNAPRAQTLGPLDGTTGTARFTFWGPATGGATDYHVELWNSATGWVDAGYGYGTGVVDWNPQVYAPAGQYVTTVYARVQTRYTGTNGQSVLSDWVGLGPANPFTAPGSPVFAYVSPYSAPDLGFVRIDFQGAGPAYYNHPSSPIQYYTLDFYPDDDGQPPFSELGDGWGSWGFRIYAGAFWIDDVIRSTPNLRPRPGYVRITAWGPGGYTIATAGPYY